MRSQNELLRDLEFIDLFSSVMFDDTHSPFEANVANSIEYRRFIEASGRRKVMEGCLEEVAAGGKGLEASASSDPDRIEEYLARTGFELVVPNIGTESVTNRQVGVQWQVLEELAARGVGQRLVVHGFSSVRRLEVAEQRRLGELGVVAMNAFSYIPQEIGRRLLQEAAALHGARDPERGYPTGFAADGAPHYPDARRPRRRQRVLRPPAGPAPRPAGGADRRQRLPDPGPPGLRPPRSHQGLRPLLVVDFDRRQPARGLAQPDPEPTGQQSPAIGRSRDALQNTQALRMPRTA